MALKVTFAAGGAAWVGRRISSSTGGAVSMFFTSTAWVRVSSPEVRVKEYQPFCVTVWSPVTCFSVPSGSVMVTMASDGV